MYLLKKYPAKKPMLKIMISPMMSSFVSLCQILLVMLPLTLIYEAPFPQFGPRDEESPYISARLQLNAVKAVTALKAEVAPGPPVSASWSMLPIPTFKDKSEIRPRVIM